MIITEYSSNDESVNISGSSASYDAIAKLVVQLKKVECIENAFVTSIDEEEDEETGSITYTFSLKCNFVSMVEEETETGIESETGDATLQAE